MVKNARRPVRKGPGHEPHKTNPADLIMGRGILTAASSRVPPPDREFDPHAEHGDCSD
jgi:hypothetical protein